MTGTRDPDDASLPPGSPGWVTDYAAELDAHRAEILQQAGVSSIDELVERAADEAREKAVPAPTWRDLEDALTALGSEEHIARRLELLRGIRGLSQEQLARRLEELGVQMP